MSHPAALRAAAFASLIWAVPVPGDAGDRIGRYVVEIRIEGTQSWKAGSDHAKSSTVEQYRIVTHVKSDGVLDTVNVKDPQFAQKQLAKAAQVQQAVRKAQGRNAGTGVATPEAYAALQQDLAAQAQKEQAACKGDTACLMQMAVRYSQQSAAIGYPAGAAATGTDIGADAAEDGGDEEARYLNYFGYEGCPTEISIRIDRHSEGAYADVAGMIPWTSTQTAQSQGSEVDRKLQCLAATTVLDVRSATIYTDGFGVPAVRGRSVRKDRLHAQTVNEDAEVPASREALEWVSQQLRQAPAAGSKSTTLVPRAVMSGNAPEQARIEGRITVSLSWKFEP